jgi:peroxiredoxin
LELEALGKSHSAIKNAGGALVAISPQLPAHNQAMISERKLSFDILSDPGNQVAAAYGLRHQLPEDLKAVYQKFGISLPEANGDDTWTLPLPARYIIDAAGLVRYAQVNADYTIRPEPEDTLEALTAL